ncbi:hypothetical protein NL341_27950, partial [Klebsiella pneumoniae]|nr:hypothetical protein [Klebsiella pneumoniae]
MTKLVTKWHNSDERPNLKTVGINQLVSLFSYFGFACWFALGLFLCELAYKYIAQKNGKKIDATKNLK